MRYIRFFLGTPQRFLVSLVFFGALVALGYTRPDIVEQGLYNLLGAIFGAIQPFVGSILVLVIAGIGFRVMLYGFGRGR